MSMNDFLSGVLNNHDLSRLSIVDDNAKISHVSRMKACSSFGTIDEARKEQQHCRWSRLTRQDSDSALLSKTKRPKSSSTTCLGQQSRVASDSSLTCPRRMESPTTQRKKLTGNGNASKNATWDNEDIARLQNNKSAASMLCLLNLEGAALATSAKEEEEDDFDTRVIMADFASCVAPPKAPTRYVSPKTPMRKSLSTPDATGMSLEFPLARSSLLSNNKMSMSGSSHNISTIGGRSRSGIMSRSSYNDFGDGGMMKSSNTFGGTSSKVKSLRSALGSLAPTSTMKTQKALKPRHEKNKNNSGNATFQAYKVPSKSALLCLAPGARA
jgi:hypothetical protein